jgi:type IV secretory pathway VirD2 relaxase
MGADFDDDPLLGLAGLEFLTPVRPKRAKPPGKRSMRLSGAQIGRIARRRPEVMVKVTGSARGLRGIKEHLAYITRNGKITGERENGEQIEGAREVREVAEEWWADGVGRRKSTRDTINLILSMPPGTDQNAVAEAARAFAQKTFGGDYDYLLAHHNRDADPKRPENPHAHLTVKRRGRHGQSLNPRKADLQAWREAFAAELRARGVIAEATPRRTRGVVRKGQRQAIRHMDARKATRVTKWKLIQAVKTASVGNDGAEELWAKAAKEKQRKVRRAWHTLAAAFEQAGQPKLAQQIKQFVSSMPPAQTEREHFIDLAKKLLAKQQVRDRGRSR